MKNEIFDYQIAPKLNMAILMIKHYKLVSTAALCKLRFKPI